jgi:cytochrome c553|tara:strand:+ start:10902 stop:11345 length:444 start_codon:yes stop_codon:yes gene_type:complete
MRELGMTLIGCLVIATFFTLKVYPNLEYTGYSSNTSCTGQCYVDYVALNGTSVDILRAKQELANADEFSSIRSLWSGCAACHGAEGQGMAVFPALAGQSSDYITQRLYAYKNRETVGAMSSTMWAQAGMLSDADIQTIGKFIQQELK